MLNRAKAGKASFQSGEAVLLVEAVRRATRIEVQCDDHGLRYVALFDGDSDDGRHAAKYFEAKLGKVEQAIKRHTPHGSPRRPTEVRLASRDTPAKGEVCPRLMTSLRDAPWPGTGLPPD